MNSVKGAISDACESGKMIPNRVIIPKRWRIAADHGKDPLHLHKKRAQTEFTGNPMRRRLWHSQRMVSRMRGHECHVTPTESETCHGRKAVAVEPGHHRFLLPKRPGHGCQCLRSTTIAYKHWTASDGMFERLWASVPRLTKPAAQLVRL